MTSYIISSPVANEVTTRGVESSPINISPTITSSINLIEPSYIRISVPALKHFPAPVVTSNNALPLFSKKNSFARLCQSLKPIDDDSSYSSNVSVLKSSSQSVIFISTFFTIYCKLSN